MQQTIYIATGNSSKLKGFQRFFSWIDPQILVKQVPDYISVKETGKTLAENSKLKIQPYIGKYKYPIIANDAGLEFDKRVEEMQDPTKIKRNALGEDSEDSLSQEEIGKRMFDFYRKIARKYGGRIKCVMNDVYTILLPNGTIRQEKASREYILVDRDVDKYDIYHPLNSLRISTRTNTFLDEMTPEENRVDKEVLIEALRRLINPIT